MRTVTGVIFEYQERQELLRCTRWIGIHPQANLASTRKRSETVRDELAALLNGVGAESADAVFRERLERLRTVLQELLTQAERESDPTYWQERVPVERKNLTSRESTFMKYLLTEARQQACEDLYAALAIIDQAILVASPANIFESVHGKSEMHNDLEASR